MLNSTFVRRTPQVTTRHSAVILLALSMSLFGIGCAGSQKQSVTEAFYDTPGNYPAAPLNEAHPRVGLPAPATEVTRGAAAGAHPDSDAADQLLWVADRS